MTDQQTPRAALVRWLWWALAGLLGAGLVIDIVDGAPLKLATSSLLFTACLLSAAVRQPRRPLVAGTIVACFGLAGLLVLYRALGPGL